MVSKSSLFILASLLAKDTANALHHLLQSIMKKVTTLLSACTFIVVGSLFSSAYAQIVIQQSALTDRLGSTVNITLFDTESGTGLDGLVAASGANQTWDFSALSFADTTVFTQSYVTLPADLPGSVIPELATAEFVEYTTATFGTDTLKTLLYQRISNDSLLSHGTLFIGDVDGMQDTLVTLAIPPALDGLFPIEYQKTYQDSTSFVFEDEPVPTYQITEVTIDGWGTLVAPGQTVEALRIYNVDKTYLIDTNQLLSEEVNIDFVSAEGLTANIELDESLNPVNGSVAVVGEVPTSIDRVDEIAKHFTLNQNYPNPFATSTSISYHLDKPAHVEIKVYTLTGQLVKSLVSTNHAAGVHETALDAAALPSGIYAYRLVIDGASETRFMSLVR